MFKAKRNVWQTTRQQVVWIDSWQTFVCEYSVWAHTYVRTWASRKQPGFNPMQGKLSLLSDVDKLPRQLMPINNDCLAWREPDGKLIDHAVLIMYFDVLYDVTFWINHPGWCSENKIHCYDRTPYMTVHHTWPCTTHDRAPHMIA